MSKSAALKEENQAIAKLSSLRISPSKLMLVSNLIRGLTVEDALVQLQFSRKRIARDVLKCLKSAIANAENNHAMNIDELYIAEVRVGKSLVMKRFRPAARGRGVRIHKFFSKLAIVVKER